MVDQERSGRKMSMMRQSTIGNSEQQPKTNEERIRAIKSRRKSFSFMPVYFSNDMVHGSWWFVLGSFLSMIIPILPLLRQHISFMNLDKNLNTLDALNYSATWILLIISGAFFTVGSYGFVRASEETQPPPLLGTYFCGHCASDELFAAWCFFLAVLPAAPFCIIFLAAKPNSLTYMGMTVIALLCIIGCYLFVMACYPHEDKKEFEYIKKFFHWMGIKNSGVINTHLANDWLAGTWFFLFATFLMLAGSIYELYHSIHVNNGFEIYIWATGGFDTVLFLIGSIYFVSGK